MELEPHEKFHDTDGEILEIETRGRRHVDEIFFRVRDVMKRFDMPRLNNILRDKTANYEVGIHFRTFTVVNCVDHNKNNTKKPVKSLFLTYHGLMRVLIVSRNKNAEKFSRWAITKLFAMQLLLKCFYLIEFKSDSRHDSIVSKYPNRILLMLLRLQIAAV